MEKEEYRQRQLGGVHCIKHLNGIHGVSTEWRGHGPVTQDLINQAKYFDFHSCNAIIYFLTCVIGN